MSATKEDIHTTLAELRIQLVWHQARVFEIENAIRVLEDMCVDGTTETPAARGEVDDG